MRYKKGLMIQEVSSGRVSLIFPVQGLKEASKLQTLWKETGISHNRITTRCVKAGGPLLDLPVAQRSVQKVENSTDPKGQGRQEKECLNDSQGAWKTSQMAPDDVGPSALVLCKLTQFKYNVEESGRSPHWLRFCFYSLC